MGCRPSSWARTASIPRACRSWRGSAGRQVQRAELAGARRTGEGPDPEQGVGGEAAAAAAVVAVDRDHQPQTALLEQVGLGQPGPYAGLAGHHRDQPQVRLDVAAAGPLTGRRPASAARRRSRRGVSDPGPGRPRPAARPRSPGPAPPPPRRSAAVRPGVRWCPCLTVSGAPSGRQPPGRGYPQNPVTILVRRPLSRSSRAAQALRRAARCAGPRAPRARRTSGCTWSGSPPGWCAAAWTSARSTCRITVSSRSLAALACDVVLGGRAVQRQRLDRERGDQRGEQRVRHGGGDLVHPDRPGRGLVAMLGARRLHRAEDGGVRAVGEVVGVQTEPVRLEQRRGLQQQLHGLALGDQQPVVRLGQPASVGGRARPCGRVGGRPCRTAAVAALRRRLLWRWLRPLLGALVPGRGPHHLPADLLDVHPQHARRARGRSHRSTRCRGCC